MPFRELPAMLRPALMLALLLAGGCSSPAGAPVVATQAAPVRATQVEQSSNGMVVSGSPIASRVGAVILEQGGNAVDAAVATAFALSVVEPTMSGLGGRTQLLIRTAAGDFFGLDGTTEVPAGYPPGAVPADDDAYGYTTIAIPGTVAVLAAALEQHGTMSLAAVLQPAIRLAEDGFALPADEAGRLASVAARLAEFEGSRQYFLRPDGTPYRAGDNFVQRDLGGTLRTIASDGPAGFYGGAVARRMAEDMLRNGGFVTAADLAGYRAEPALLVRGSYHGVDIVGTYLPASGATTIEILQILEHFDLPPISGTPRWAALLASALLLGFTDRTADLGEPAEHAALITSKQWAARRARDIRVPALPPSPPAASRSSRSSPHSTPTSLLPEYEPAHTTHLSVADEHGGAVSLTQSVGPIMGSKVAAPGLGFVYAATMGYLGSLQPGGRPFSSQSPLILERDGELAYVVGAAGARRIISALVAVLSRAIDEQLALPEAMAAPRLHVTESAIDMEMRQQATWTAAQLLELNALGFTVRERADAPYFGRINAIGHDAATLTFTGVSDPRWTGAAAAPQCSGACAPDPRR